MSVQFLSRAELDLRPPRSRSFNIQPEQGGTTGHYAGDEQNVSPLLRGHTRCINLWRGYQNYHMDTRRWVDIAYTGGVCDHGYAFAGRGARVRTAANGTAAGNDAYYAICWIGGGAEKPTAKAIEAMEWWVAKLRADGGAGRRVVPHSFHKNTGCPGASWRSILPRWDNKTITTEDDLMGWSNWVPQKIRDWADTRNVTTEHTRHRDNITAEQVVVMIYRAVYGTGVEEGANHALNLKAQMKAKNSVPAWVGATIDHLRETRGGVAAADHDHPKTTASPVEDHDHPEYVARGQSYRIG